MCIDGTGNMLSFIKGIKANELELYSEFKNIWLYLEILL